MSLFAIADTHLSLAVDKPMDIFGSRWSSYTEKLKTEWLDAVGEDDTVVIPGDISWGMSLEEALPDLLFLDSLPGKKIIGRGNHDYWWSTATKIKACFTENGISSISLLHNNAFEYDDRIICGSRGWFFEEKAQIRECDNAKITAREAGRLCISLDAANKINPGKEKVVFLHFPPVYGTYICREITDVLARYGVRRVYCGHIHGVYDMPCVTSFDGTDYYMIAADYLNFRPLLID